MPTITSEDILPDIESHFRVSAGPGAGKTYWLVNHIKNVLQKSNRLDKTRKIACITYTNIAVETILKSLGTSTQQVEVSTIHSFLYKHIVKPYAWAVASDYGLCVSKMDGHDEVAISIKKVIDWIENHPNMELLQHPFTKNQLIKIENNKRALIRWLSSLTYKFSTTNDLELYCNNSEAYYLENNNRRYLGARCLDILKTNLLDFKKQYWQEGILHHEDVLFFSHQIIQKKPFVLKVLRTKFPYFFVDEFQDSNPIQVKILHQIAQEETITGIIGDKAQSIYGFQGADYSQFAYFTLPHLINYEMQDNRRSTNEIIDILNHIRIGDIQQNKKRDIQGNKPILLIGDMISALRKVRIICNNESVISLSRDNITSNAMKKEIGGITLNDKLLDELKDVDSNSDRRNLIIACIKAVELAREKKFKDAIKELERIFKDPINKDKGRKEALKAISILLAKYNDFKHSSLFTLFNLIKTEIRTNISNLRDGNSIKTFYETHTYQSLALCVKIPEDISLHKTIHKAKGDEFDNVLLVLKNENDIEFLTNPDLTKEEHRVYYVAVSRAKENLFISIPHLQETNKIFLSSIFRIELT